MSKMNIDLAEVYSFILLENIRNYRLKLSHLAPCYLILKLENCTSLIFWLIFENNFNALLGLPLVWLQLNIFGLKTYCFYSSACTASSPSCTSFFSTLSASSCFISTGSLYCLSSVLKNSSEMENNEFILPNCSVIALI
jgi:hypothetical protein